jgi:thymidine kinase
LEINSIGCGWIEAICGPMFSGKTEELIRRLRRAVIAREQIQVFKPAIDNRFSETEIVTHGEMRMESQPVSNAEEIAAALDVRTQVVGIDECNFFGPGLVDLANRIADAGRRVIVAGLDTDFLGRPFPPMPELLAIAESITKLQAVCMRCGAPANHSQRLAVSEDLILVGARDVYEPRCRRCFEPGIPKQTCLNFT